MKKIYQDFWFHTFPNGQLQCNCTVIVHSPSRRCLIVDPGNDSSTIFEYLKKENLEVLGLLHTHAHFDHIGHSPVLSRELNTPLHLHKQDLFLYEGLEMQGTWFREKTAPPIELKKEWYLEEGQTFHWAGPSTKLEVLSTPGHTPGSCCFYTENFGLPLLLAGDTLFYSSIGRTDLPGGDMRELQRSLKNKVLQLPPETLVIPGHGCHTTIEREQKHNPYLQSLG